MTDWTRRAPKTASRRSLLALLLTLAAASGAFSQVLPERVLIGYWHNWGSSPNSLTLAAVPPEYDVIIVDCAPTGATLQLLTMPEVGRWYLDRILPWEKKIFALSRPLVRAVTDRPLPQVFEGAFPGLTLRIAG